MKVDLDQLLELEAKATPAPWVACGDIFNGCVSVSAKGEVRKDLFRSYEATNMQSADDARITSAMRNSIKELCLEVKALMEVESEARGLVNYNDGFIIGLADALKNLDEARRG